MSIIEKTRRNLREGGIRQFLYATVRGATARLGNLYLYHSHWQGRIVELLGDHAKVDGIRLDLKGAEMMTRHKAMLVKGFYEISERRLVKRYLPADMPVIDLGGCLGVVSCVINRKLTSPERHVVVEANSGLVPTLKRTRELNGAKFQIVHAAVAHGVDTVQFFVSKAFTSGGVRQKTEQCITAPAKTLRQLADEAGFERFNLVCDIEGAEMDIVREELDVLRDRCEWIIMEVHPTVLGQQAVTDMLATLAEAGFKQVDSMTNVVALHRES